VITASAPGKVVLSGEYAVLHGAPAIATAVDRRVRVTVADSSEKYHSIVAPRYLEGTWHFCRGEDGAIEWLERLPASSTFSLVEEVWRNFDTAPWPPLSLVVDTQEFSDQTTGLKLGLGSSAAVSVALTAALQRFAAAGHDPGKLAMAAHERFQEGQGSGVDVAASLHGGLIEYRRAGAETCHLGWPAGLHYRFLWSGQAAITAEKLARLREQGGKDSSMNLLRASAEKIATTWSLGDCRQILDSYPAYIDALRNFSVDHDLGIFDAGHDALVRLAAGVEVVYKPCGAGGGDIGVALAESEDAIQVLCEQAMQRGFESLETATENEGVQIAGEGR